jgi:cysteine desulfurase
VVPVAYLDHAASTPMRPEAVAAMLPLLTQCFGNATGAHSMARAARTAIDEARDQIAALLGVAPGGVIFTATGTEADNLAIFGLASAAGVGVGGSGKRGVAVCGAAEHHAVLHPVEQSGGRIVPVDGRGRVDLERLADALDEDVSVVSVMAVNNEVGTIEDIAGVADVVRARAPGAALHCDAVQAMSWIDVAAVAACCDAVSISGHKIGGPKGVGALVLTGERRITAQILGGGQERERRSGTHDTASIVALAAAAQMTVSGRDDMTNTVARLRDRLVDGLITELGGVYETVPRADKVAGNAHVCVDGIESEALLFLVDRAGVCASAGSSCSSGAVSMSHVLAAMGVSAERARGAVRFTLGYSSTDADVDRALEVVIDSARRLRR